MLRYRYLIYSGLLTLGVLAPFIFRDEYVTHLLVLTMIFARLALSYDIIIGFMGQFSFGHQVFFGLGAYTSALFALYLKTPVWLGLPAAVLIAGVAGLFVGAISLRTRGPYLAIVTLGFAVLAQMIATGWREFTGGFVGLLRIPPLEMAQIVFTSNISYYYLAFALLLLTIYLIGRLRRSRFGRAVIALSENEERAASLGIDPFRYYLVAFAIGAAMAGLAGFAYCHYIRYINPGVFGFYYLVISLVTVLVGGSGTLAGPVLGSFIFIFVPELLRIAEDLRLVLFGAIIVVCIIFMPQGIYPALVSVWRRVTRMWHSTNSNLRRKIS